MLASSTRLIGVFLLPAMAWNIIVVRVRRAVPLQIYFFCFLIPLGLLAYMLFLQLKFGDALYFLHAQGAFGASRATNVVFPLVTICAI